VQDGEQPEIRSVNVNEVLAAAWLLELGHATDSITVGENLVEIFGI